MKTMDAFIKPVLFTLILTLGFVALHAQDSAKKKPSKEDVVKGLIEKKEYVFVAQMALPMAGGSRQLTSYYDFKVYGDTLKSDLPYYGRAFSAPIDPSKGGITFTSTDFEYTVTDRKKGGWDITITPRNNADWRQFVLTVFTNGSSSLRASSNNRQPISFNGYIDARPVKKK